MKIPSKRELQQIASNHLSNSQFKGFVKLYKSYTKVLYYYILIFVKNTVLPSDNSLIFRKNLLRNDCYWKRSKQLIINRTKESAIKFRWQIATIFALSSRDDSIYELLAGKYILPEKDLLEKAATIKRFEYLLLSS